MGIPAVAAICAIAALACAGAADGAGVAAAGAPALLAAGPHGDPSDRPGGGLLRVTFSPDGDGRRDLVRVRVRARPGDRVALRVRAESQPRGFDLAARRLGSRPAVLTWDGAGPDGRTRPDGSFLIRACSVVTGLCSGTGVLAHLRVLSVFTPLVEAASVGETIPVVVASDRRGPFTLDLVSAAKPEGPGVGARTLARPGRVGYRVPAVAGGLWLLRVASGRVARRFPLVVHERRLPLAAPPRGTALVVYPYVTWRAYDLADESRDGEEGTWYAHPRRPVVALRGPFEGVRREAALAGRESNPRAQRAFTWWLRLHGLVAQHVTDVELGRLPPEVLRRYAVVVFPGHTEYYERHVYDRLLAYRAAGGRLYFLSGNSFYGEVRIRRTTIVRLSYRYRTPERSDFRIAATGFRSCCWPASIRPRYRLASGVRRRLPWLLAGTGLKAGDELGLAQGEVDTVDPRLSPPGTVTVASATVPPFARRKAQAYAWLGTRRIAYEAASVREQRVDVAYAAVGRGEVFSWGNTGFMRSLRDHSLPAAERAALDRVALNVWRRFTR